MGIVIIASSKIQILNSKLQTAKKYCIRLIDTGIIIEKNSDRATAIILNYTWLKVWIAIHTINGRISKKSQIIFVY